MKIYRFVAFLTIALLAVGAIGAISMRAHAQMSTPPVQAQSCAQQDNDAHEIQGATDVDNVDLQCGDQNGPDNQQEAQERESSEGEDPTPTGTPAITAEAAQKAAEAYLNAGTAVRVQLDDENGKLVYSVEFPDGTDVKVDAMSGTVLGAELGED